MVMNINSYEVKNYILSDVVLNGDGELLESFKTTFGINESLTMNVAYLDTNSKDFNDFGWNLRMRKKSSSKKHELDYKKRYIGDVSSTILDAERDGFPGIDFEAEVDISYKKNTLSFSNEVKKDYKIGNTLPEESIAKADFIDNCPNLLKDWNDKILYDKIESLRYYGPVMVRRYKGNFLGKEVTIEALRVITEDKTGFEDITEISSKLSTAEDAETFKFSLESFLEEKSILDTSDILKTQIILNRY